ncbi:MAG: hypothetical protein MUP76_04955, partial [Acidimicrobiia bacterium]|nr:hypothetical protein [Acidimicrobiia bacterium]
MTPKEAQSPEHQAKLAARETFRAARTEWRDAKARIEQIKSAIDSDDIDGDEKARLIAEKKTLKAALADMGAKVRSTKAIWLKLKEAAQEAGTATAE